jgi:hypothetical protein
MEGLKHIDTSGGDLPVSSVTPEISHISPASPFALAALAARAAGGQFDSPA